jgi:hypothetical protein
VDVTVEYQEGMEDLDSFSHIGRKRSRPERSEAIRIGHDFDLDDSLAPDREQECDARLSAGILQCPPGVFDERRWVPRRVP